MGADLTSDLALITLSAPGVALGLRLAQALGPAGRYAHRDVAAPGWEPFDRVAALTGELFGRCRRLVYIMPTGVVVRALAGCPQHKLTDPAVVVLDVKGRWAISLLSGHEGGANALAHACAAAICAEPIVTTSTQALKDLVVGVGCRRGASAASIREAVTRALAACGGSLDRVRLLASADLKRDEPGLLAAAAGLDLPLRFLASEELRRLRLDRPESTVARRHLDLPGVAEPAAMLAGRRTRLLQPRIIWNGVTAAVAQEEDPT
jgi:cobalt-precorrin 5A hydrolase